MSLRLDQLGRRVWPLVVLLVFLAAGAAVCTAGSTVLQRNATTALIDIVLVVGL